MTITTWEFYTEQYLKGDAPTLSENNFDRWISNAWIAVNRSNLIFADVVEVAELEKAFNELLLIRDEELDVGDDFLTFVKDRFEINEIEVTVEINEDEHLIISTETLEDTYEFEITEDSGIFHLTRINLISEPHEVAPEVIQKMVIEYAEAMFGFNKISSSGGLVQSEGNFGYTYSLGDIEKAKAQYEQNLLNIVAKYVAQTEYRQYFYGLGSMIGGF